VGRVADFYQPAFDLLDGRLVQVVELFQDSGSGHKIAYNTKKKGVAIAVIIDRFVPGNRALDMLRKDINLDSSSKEE